MRQVVRHVAHRRNFQRRSDDQYKIDTVNVLIRKAREEVVGKLFTEECDVRFHDAWLWNVVVFVLIIGV